MTVIPSSVVTLISRINITPTIFGFSSPWYWILF